MSKKDSQNINTYGAEPVLNQEVPYSWVRPSSSGGPEGLGDLTKQGEKFVINPSNETLKAVCRRKG